MYHRLARALRRPHAALFLTSAMLAGACAPLQQWLPLRESADVRMARTVTIVRDAWGVPTIYAPTDAAAVFGVAFAQAEDGFHDLEEGYIHALGLASYWYGEPYLAADLVRAAFEVVRLAREEYEREPAERRALWQAWANGLNYYMRVTGTQPRVIARFEPWMLFARARGVSAGMAIDGVQLGGGGLPEGGLVYVGAWVEPGASGDLAAGRTLPIVAPRDRLVGYAAGAGPAAWAVGPSRTATGQALLVQHTFSTFAGPNRPYELHLHSETGWHVRGQTLAGTPIPRVGHTEHHAWGHGPSTADRADVYEVTFDHPTDPLQYRYDAEWRHAHEWEHELHVNTPRGVERRVYRFRRTHHGPVVAQRDGRGLAVRIARHEEGGALQQSLALGRAASPQDFQAALDARALAASTVYADRNGTILVVHAGAVPRRDPAFDWTRPVPGNTSATAWQGWHELTELPQQRDPLAGWLQSNLTESDALSGDGRGPARYPSYMLRLVPDARAERAQRLLAADSAWTLDGLARAAFDTRVPALEDAVAPLVLEWENVGGLQPRRAMRIDQAVDLLRAWDGVSRMDAPEMTLFVLWQERLRTMRLDADERHFRAMEDVVERLERDFGTARVPWGDINRLQRPVSGTVAFDPDAPSLAVPGAPSWTGIAFEFDAPEGARGLRFGTRGLAWVGVVELAPQPRSRAVAVFGQSHEPASPHRFDQAPLYVSGTLRDAWFARDDVMGNARAVYHPGIAPRP